MKVYATPQEVARLLEQVNAQPQKLEVERELGEKIPPKITREEISEISEALLLKNDPVHVVNKVAVPVEPFTPDNEAAILALLLS